MSLLFADVGLVEKEAKKLVVLNNSIGVYDNGSTKVFLSNAGGGCLVQEKRN